MDLVLASAERSFALVDDDADRPAAAHEAGPGRAALLDRLRGEQIGRFDLVTTPFGPRPLVYADWTASARALTGVEDFVRRRVLPLYGNTHTAASACGAQSSAFVAEARRLVGEYAGARTAGKAAVDVVLFCGAGATAATCKLVALLGLERGGGGAARAPGRAPVVFVGPFEHHSNLLPWRESAAVVVTIAADAAHGLDLADLEAQLARHAGAPLLVGAFSACSNVTGRRTDVDAVTAVLRRHGALSCWDYATLAPHEAPAMNTPARSLDAVCFSCHKLLGGVGAPGVLVVKKSVIDPARAPSQPGGGTVFYATKHAHRFLSNRVDREQGGTPDIVGAARAGVATLLGRALGHAAGDRSVDRRRVVDRLRAAGVTVLAGRGDPEYLRLGGGGGGAEGGGDVPILPLLVRCGDRWLHYNFVCQLLNDLFGIQCRGGCQCAGPYAHDLLGLSDAAAELVEEALLADKTNEILRPGFTRLSLPSSAAFAGDDEVEYVVGALAIVAEVGWRALPLYRAEERTGEWRHASRVAKPLGDGRRWLSSIDWGGAAAEPAVGAAAPDWAALLAAGRDRLVRCGAEKCGTLSPLEDAFEPLRWFVTPAEASAKLARDRATGAVSAAWVDGDVPAGPLRPPMTTEAAWDATAATLAMRAFQGAATRRKAETKKPKRAGLPDAPHGGDEGRADAAPTCDDSSDDDGAAPRTAAPLPAPTDKARAAHPTPPAADCAPCRGVAQMDVDMDDAATAATCIPVALAAPVAVSVAAPDLPLSKKKAKRLTGLPKKLLKCVGEAVRDWGMIAEGDRILVGLSGGKDSLSLLHVLLDLQRRAPVRFEIACCTVDPQTPSFDPSPLIPYVKSLGVEYYFLRDPIIAAAAAVQPTSLCAYCARMKRGALYSCAAAHGFNKLALGQHLDDLAESFVMAALHNGQLRTMRAKYVADRGITVIRPLAYAREGMMADYARAAELPVINENCPACFEEPKERARVKKLLSREEALYPTIYSSLKKALLPLMDDRTYAVLARNVSAAAAPPAAPADLTSFDDDALRAELERRSALRQRIA
ncbi:pyridoxal phosphate-dependent transferase [Pelagophyceae sp. CCMP2097]|nr:pyridoxal phosphate-dependent transferase [Pelagophyceae sp. CCMP2097]